MKVYTNVGIIEAEESTLQDIIEAFQMASIYAFKEGKENLSERYGSVASLIYQQIRFS